MLPEGLHAEITAVLYTTAALQLDPVPDLVTVPSGPLAGGLRVVAMGQRKAGVGSAAGGGGDAGNDFEGNAGGGQRLQFLAAAPEDEGVAALQAQAKADRGGQRAIVDRDRPRRAAHQDWLSERAVNGHDKTCDRFIHQTTTPPPKEKPASHRGSSPSAFAACSATTKAATD